MKIRKLILLFACLACAANCLAEDGGIYKWTDKNGNVHYSSKAPDKKAKPAKLPTITRENIDKRILRVKDETPKNCDDHGGIDCSKDKDQDGSVICADGFRDAISPFAFSCLETELTSSLILINTGGKESELTETSKDSKIDLKNAKALKVTLRNKKQILAEGVSVSLSFRSKNSSLNQRLVGAGPEKLDAFSIGEYIVDLGILNPILKAEKGIMKRIQVNATCRNCRVTKGSK